MMKAEKIENVARYLEGDMETAEKQSFEALLPADEELQNLITEYKNVHQSLKMQLAPDAQDQQVLETLTALNKTYFKNAVTNVKAEKVVKVVSMMRYVKWISVAAVLVIGLLVWAPWSAGLYEKYTISREMSVVERGADQDNALNKAAALYNAKDYAGARKILQKEYMLNPGNTLLAYYFSITLIETSKAHEARTILLNLYKGESAFKYDAAYTIALSYIKEKNNPLALEWLAKIPSGTANYAKAQELISKL